MLKELHPVLPAADLKRAQTFYHEVLGLDPAEIHEDILLYRPAPETAFDIYETPNAGTAKNTQMVWESDDLEAEMTRLRSKGVVFEDYDIPGTKTVDGVATMEGSKAAWFRDTEGNFLCITQRL
ncbi:VOC family protein [Pengzhenrongella sp.]|jgi:catechol 2,3-dioxygenase-like lactoylglutathione lyase family enzyme|uniref:VOC family protein n=1 Tax=Pengzhenrongella sp. TaxID=2888820 RepID=UPI002F91C3A4